MATKKMFRLDLLAEWYRLSLKKQTCDSCPVVSTCLELEDTEILCDEEHAEDFKQAVIDKFSTDVEVEE